MMAWPSSRASANTIFTLLLSASLCVTSLRAQQTVDLEAGLRAVYRDSGAVSEHSATVAGVKAPVTYLSVGDRNDSSTLVVLLHGKAFTADTWKVVGTLDALHTVGMPAVALELHHYEGEFASSEVRSTLLRLFLDAIGWRRPVLVVAASMGGLVGSPYVLTHGRTVGYVSVSALLSTEGVSHSDVPALLVWGSQDAPTSSKAKAHEKLFTTHQKVVLPDAPHPAYLKWPKAFNAMVCEFATGVVGGEQAREALAAAGVPPLKVHADGGRSGRAARAVEGSQEL